ncbi:ABC transporter permease subunit [Anabaena sp. UHCC 0451]|uniref:ABC transporter permease subunit n=1 Tax=Anabaena sp. UHCC 0451 TaxID=2055235 RepID=UPI002B203171|nr:ABC transporter permease subunit [Anabaena sp. UHCC 0451]MEA5579624.1 ABC transporter permease subunit [Anabaena sp. UHCC 0451]
MMLNFIDRVGEWNPQLFRELKGRFKPFNVLFAVVSSLLLQLVVFLFQLREYPGEEYSLRGSYCRLSTLYQQQEQQFYQQQSLLNQKLNNYRQIKLSDSSIIPNLQVQIQQVDTQLSNLRDQLSKGFCPPNEIEWQMWWRDHWEYIFLAFSVIFIFTLLVAGTYLLISDLAQEEHRGTLNFIRLSPQSETSILTGKILGVPSLIYLFVLIAIPLHFWAGHSANIASSYILSYYAVIAASCCFFYSAALLFSLVNRQFSSFQPWLGSGMVLLLLFMTMMMASSAYNNDFNNPGAWFRFFSPWDITAYLFPNLFRIYQGSPLDNFQFFYLPVGKNIASLTGFYLLNYGICTYGLWQAIKRSFGNPQTTILSKGQSYLFLAFVQVMFLGLMMQKLDARTEVIIAMLAVINAAFIFSLILVLSPVRQNIQDWARYRHQNNRNASLWEDLVWGEKSPAILAIAINLVIAAIPLFIWIAISHKDANISDLGQGKALLAVALSIGLMLIYASIAQLMLLMKNPKRYVWSVLTIGAAISLPPIILSVLGLNTYNHPHVWVFSTFPWGAIAQSNMTTIFMALLADLTVVALLNFQFNKQVRVLGESATKALLAGR